MNMKKFMSKAINVIVDVTLIGSGVLMVSSGIICFYKDVK